MRHVRPNLLSDIGVLSIMRENYWPTARVEISENGFFLLSGSMEHGIFKHSKNQPFKFQKNRKKVLTRSLIYTIRMQNLNSKLFIFQAAHK